MGRLSALLPGIRPTDLAAAVAVSGAPAPLDIASPWAPTHHLARVLDGVVLSDVFGLDSLRPVTRAEAMTVPAAARARHIIAGTVGSVPLRRYGGDGEPLADQGWASTTSGAGFHPVPAYHRNVWTADDLLFYGWSCWARTNGADRFPLRMDRIPMGRWSVDEVGRVLVDNTVVDQRSVVLFPGPHEGILTAAATTIRHAADLQRAAAQAAKTPAAYLGLRQTQGTPLKRSSTDPTENTVETVVGDWRKARNGENGGVAFIPLGLETVELGTFSEHLLVEGRNAAALDVARHCSLPADLLDAAGPSSLTYATTRDNDQRAIQYGVGLYLRAMSAVLSMDTVTPRGQSTRFDIESWLENPTSTAPGPRPPTSAPAVPPAPAPTPELPA